jgi:hypothetical protein
VQYSEIKGDKMNTIQEISDNLKVAQECDTRSFDAINFVCAIGLARNAISTLCFFVDKGAGNEADNELRELADLALDAMGAIETLDIKARVKFKALYPEFEFMLEGVK